MSELQWRSSKVAASRNSEPWGYEHEVSVLIPWRRSNPDVRPEPTGGSPSRILLDPEERHGALLTVCRRSHRAQLTVKEMGEMTGELAEAWVSLTIVPRNK